MEKRFWVDYSLQLWEKAKKEKFLSNKDYLTDCWKWLITNKVLFYCSFKDFKEAMKNKENLEEVKGLIFTSFRLNLPMLKNWVRINSNMLMLGRFKISSGIISNVGNTVYSNSPVKVKKDLEKALIKEEDYLTIFEDSPSIIEKELNKLHITIQENYFRNWNLITKVEPFKNDNPFNTKEKQPFKYILDYFLNKEQILHNDAYWKVFEKEYITILISHLQDNENAREINVKLGNLINKYEMDNFLEIVEEDENDNIMNILWDMEEELNNEEIDEEIREFNKVLDLAVKNPKKADILLKKYFKK